MDYDSYDAVLHWVFRSTQGDAWFKPSQENISAGVCLRVEPGYFRVFPYENPYLAPFEAAVRGLNPLIAVKLRTAAVHSALTLVHEDASAIDLDPNTRIQIVDSLSHLPTAEKEQCGAFIRDERVLIVWTDSLENIVAQCKEFEEKLMKLVWRSRPTTIASSFINTNPSSVSPSTAGSNVNLTEKAQMQGMNPELVATVTEEESTEPPAKRGFWSWKLSDAKSPTPRSDAEKGLSSLQSRPIRYFAPVYIGFSAGLSVFFICTGVAMILSEFRLDQSYIRFSLLVTAPLLFCVSLFFCVQIVSNISYVIGPVAQFHQNSRFYSAVKPLPNPDVDGHLPHITLQMPVYKESLEETIAPSIFYLKRAMQTYARQGGTSSILVHDDGLQSMDEKDQEKRISFYADHNVGWVARPRHSDEPDGFKRAGRFKKASNMNYGLRLSLMLEKHLQALEAAGENGDDLEERALELAIDEMQALSGGDWRPWARNARSIRIGEIILLVDSDTVVPEDCLRDAARELAECPEVAIIQHESDVMQVAHHYFENGIAFFTRRINKCISMGCANGEVAPFVGHNAFLKWSAIQDASFIDPDDGIRKIWSESNVSEDFDMALRLQLKGYIIRWATYSDGGFKEGVSLTVDDELNRWQKYSYGCNELIFNPLVEWWRKGPINKQLRTFVWSNAPVHYKFTMMSYMFSYYGLAASAMLSVVNYLLLGLAADVDGYFMHSFEIWLACVVVFTGAGNVGYACLEYRLGRKDLLYALFENFKWVAFFFFFFGGLSIHLSTAILAHLFSYNMTWGATTKEVKRSNFWQEVPKIAKRFWLALLLSFFMIAMAIVLATPFIPEAWRIPIVYWAVIFPLVLVALGHILFPIVLNPWLMIFSY
jgi:cellulose synthase/poly-beta-1,6-N-acetylglucosamine synthase-like glycosyltransferase